MVIDSRQMPDEVFIESLRKKWPTENEVDIVLTRKMRNRAVRQETYHPVALKTLIEGTRRLLASQLAGDYELKNPRWLSGGASMLQMAFDLLWHGEDAKSEELIETKMVLRMSPMEPVVETSFLRESEVVRLVEELGVMRVPHCYWIDETGEYLPYPAMVYGFVSGVAKPTAIPSTQVTGVGLNFGPELRKSLAPQVVRDVGRLHAFDASAVNLNGFDTPTLGSNKSVVKELNWWQRVWEEDRGEDEALIQLAGSWLRQNAPPVDHVSILHNDLRSGNFLFDESNAEITAWLDWELVSLGDRHQDLGWLLADQFGHFSEDGSVFLASGLMSAEDFLAAYEAESGLSVDPWRIKYYDIFNTWKAAIIVMGTGYRVAKGGKSHQDVVVAWLSAIGYLVLENLRKAMQEVLR